MEARLELGVVDRLGSDGVVDRLDSAGVDGRLDAFDDKAGECSCGTPLMSATTFCALIPRIRFRVAMYGSTSDFPNSNKKNRRRAVFYAYFQYGLLSP